MRNALPLLLIPFLATGAGAETLSPGAPQPSAPLPVPYASRAATVSQAKTRAPTPLWLQQYPGSPQGDALYEKQEARIAQNEAVREKAVEITHAAQIPTSPRSEAILSHLKALSASLNAAARVKAPGVASQNQP